MTPTVETLDLPVTGYLQTRRGEIAEVAMSAEPDGPLRLYLRVPEGAGELSPGLYSTSVAALLDDDPDEGWLLTVVLEPEEPGAEVRRDPVFDARYPWEETDLAIAQHREDLELDGPVPERECEVDPFGLWAVDEQGRAFVVEGGVDDESGLLWLHPVSPYGRALHPGVYDAVAADDAQAPALDDDDALVPASAVQALQVYLYDGFPDAPHGVWRIGSRAALEAEAEAPLPEYDPTDWLRWLVPVDGGDPVPVLLADAADGSVAFEVLGARAPSWAAGRAVTAAAPRPDQAPGDRRELSLLSKPVAELRSSNAKIRKRAPSRVGRFVLEAEGWMPEGWSALG
ncbi:hypothetical protein D8Y24_04905 [Agrococcus lahaulensis]|nr:hypothetical protein D8Y24_04905 [Agrococcus lahaulensis]